MSDGGIRATNVIVAAVLLARGNARRRRACVAMKANDEERRH